MGPYPTSRAGIYSVDGWLTLGWNLNSQGIQNWEIYHTSISRIEDHRRRWAAAGRPLPNPAPVFGFSTATYGGTQFQLPHWFFVGLCAGLAAIPWLRWRFSLRTLLIATTLLAVVLGLAVWAAG
jgi:hypothetical protein